jgi:hypothetical protein
MISRELPFIGEKKILVSGSTYKISREKSSLIEHCQHLTDLNNEK